jgi:hypothetical protein
VAAVVVGAEASGADVPAGASGVLVVVGGSVGMVTSPGFSPLMAGEAGPSSLHAVTAPNVAIRATARAKARRPAREGL